MKCITNVEVNVNHSFFWEHATSKNSHGKNNIKTLTFHAIQAISRNYSPTIINKTMHHFLAEWFLNFFEDFYKRWTKQNYQDIIFYFYCVHLVILCEDENCVILRDFFLFSLFELSLASYAIICKNQFSISPLSISSHFTYLTVVGSF